MSTAVAVVLFCAVTAYAILGGADFGAGFWDLIAGGAARGERPRRGDRPLDRPRLGGQPRLVDLHLRGVVDRLLRGLRLDHSHAVRPADVGRVRHRPPRGSSFAFRKTVFRTRDRRNFGAAFALSSVLVPYCMGAVAGAIASGRVPAGGQAGNPWSSWVNPTSILGGVLAVVVVAYLAAVYLVWDSRRLADEVMEAYFRGRAIAAAIVAGVVALIGIFVLRADARYLFDELTTRALPVVILSGLCGTASLILLVRRGERGARILAIGAVTGVVIAWGVAQWPYILPTSMKVADAAAPSGTLTAILVATVGFALIVLPAFVLLYFLDQKSLLPEEGVA